MMLPQLLARVWWTIVGWAIIGLLTAAIATVEAIELRWWISAALCGGVALGAGTTLAVAVWFRRQFPWPR